MRFLVDESVAQSFAPALRAAGHEARHIREIGRAGATDDEVRAIALERREILIACDLDFSDERIPPQDHPGIIILRVWPNLSPELMANGVVARLSQLDAGDIAGNIVVMEPGTTRIRKKPK